MHSSHSFLQKKNNKKFNLPVKEKYNLQLRLQFDKLKLHFAAFLHIAITFLHMAGSVRFAKKIKRDLSKQLCLANLFHFIVYRAGCVCLLFVFRKKKCL